MSEEKRMELSKKDGKARNREEIRNESELVNREASKANEEANQLKTENSKLETVNMEVHHHPHVAKKNFKEYFLEFIMIFLAVTLGFFAENIREYYAEIKTGREYLETFQEELAHNKTVIHDYDSVYASIMPAQDSMVMILSEKKENENLQTMGRLILKSKRVIAPPIAVAAYDQMVNSGGLKYIHNAILKDSMSHYAGLIQRFQNYNSVMNNIFSSAIPELYFLEDIHDLKYDHVPQLMPYPVLTERERRFIGNFYRTSYIQFSHDRELLASLSTSNKNLLSMTQNEFKK